MNREEFIRVARQVSTWEKGTIPFRAAFDQLIAEFDRLKAENERLKVSHRELEDCLGDSGRRVKSLQSWLDRISEAYDAKYHFDLDWIESQLHEKGYWYASKSLQAIRAYLDSQKPSEKPKEEHGCLGFCYVNGRCIPQKDCPICNPKDHTHTPPTGITGESPKPPPCPECQGTKYINRVVSVTDWEWHRYYMIVDCLNCKGEGVI